MQKGNQTLVLMQQIRRIRDQPPASRPWWCYLLVWWVLAGVLICAERMPDVVGHAHDHAPGHLDTPWHGESDDDTGLGEDGRKAPDFHYHVTIDYTSIDSDACMPPDLHPVDSALAASPDHDDDPPLAPWLWTDGPPLI